jgi:hypothetical protein
MIGRRLVVIKFDQQSYEADYRFALVHARDNVEPIALYRGTKEGAAVKLSASPGCRASEPGRGIFRGSADVPD